MYNKDQHTREDRKEEGLSVYGHVRTVGTYIHEGANRDGRPAQDRIARNLALVASRTGYTSRLPRKARSRAQLARRSHRLILRLQGVPGVD